MRRRRTALVAAAASLAAITAIAASARAELVVPRASRLFLDRRGEFLAEIPGDGDALGHWPLPDAIPERIVRATLAAEDRRFFEHPGVSGRSLLRAAWQDLRALRIVSGGSTIAMQTARLQAPGERSVLRKAREAVEALLLVRRHGHERVLRQYLTIAPYGHRVRGVARAARLYFDKPVEDLSWAQAALLAALPQAPGRMDPYEPDGLRRATARARRILRSLHARGAIDRDELGRALEADLAIVPPPRREPAAIHAVLALAAASAAGPPIRTATLDLEIQRIAARALADALAALREADAGNAAAVVLDPDDGAVLAHVGSVDYFAEEARGAIDYARVPRSPGSTLKPFVYALALESGRLTAASEIEDTPLEIADGAGGAFFPENANRAFFGPMLLRPALANSRNVPALRVAAAVGPDAIQRLLADAGVAAAARPERQGLGVAIGTLPVSLEELARAYVALARGGTAIPLRRFADEPSASPRRIVSEEATALVADVLADPEARRPTFAPGGPLDFDHAVAVKTGTSQGFRDAWTVAWSDRLVVAVWIGNHDRRRMNQVSGQSGAAPAAHAILEAVTPLRAPHRAVLPTFPLPGTLSRRTVCALSGRLAGAGCPQARVEAFLAGTEPVEPCPWHRPVAVDVRNGLRAGAGCPPRFVVRRKLLDLPERYAAWARAQRLEIAPLRDSPLCGDDAAAPQVSLVEPRQGARYLFDPETPREAATIRLAARAVPADEPVVFLVDGVPVATVGYPHEFRWTATPGAHVVSAALARRRVDEARARIVVAD